MDSKKRKKYDTKYLEMAQIWSELSHAKRTKVGAILVKDNTIIADGYNGTPQGFENDCEDEQNTTKWYVLHAEANAILKVARSTQSSENSTLYVTLSPCKECAKLIVQAGIKRVLYTSEYRDTTGVEFLQKTGIDCQKMDIPPHT
jgi:dCMP deaminase